MSFFLMCKNVYLKIEVANGILNLEGFFPKDPMLVQDN